MPLTFLTVTACPNPPLEDSQLPQCWSFVGGLDYTNEDGTISRTKRLVNRSAVGDTTLTASAGSTTWRVRIIVCRAVVQVKADRGDCLLTQHAWWDLFVEPSSVYPFLNDGMGDDLSGYLGEGGYFGEENNPACECPGCPGLVIMGPQPIRGTTNYYSPTGYYWWCVSFSSMLNALAYVADLQQNPRMYIISSTGLCGHPNDCVTQAEAVALHAGVSTGYDGWSACAYSDWLNLLWSSITPGPPGCNCND